MFENLNKNIGFGGMRTLPGPLSEKLNFNFAINSKADFSGGQKREKFHLDIKFHITQGITPWNLKNMRNCYFGGYFVGLRTNVEFNGFVWFCEFLKVSASIKNSFNFKVGFFTYLEYISGAIIRKYILRSDYDSARWYWCKKDQKNLPETSNQFFSQCFIFSQCLWAFTVQSVCKNSFSRCKRRKKWYSCNKNPIFFVKSPPELQVSMS